MYGDKLDNEGSYSKKFTCELEPEWNTDKMRVLAFLNRSGERYGHMQVINSCETNIKSTGIESVWGDTHNAFSVEGRDIVATSGWQIEVYTLEGARVPGNGLCPGIYIVKAYGADGVSASKVAIN